MTAPERSPRPDADTPLDQADAVARALLSHGSELVGLQAASGTLLYINPVVERLLGYRPDDVTGRAIFEFVHPEDLDDMIAAQRRLLELGGVGPGMETRVRHADGSWRLLDIVSTNMLDNPAVRALMLIGRDVTERRDAERALRDRDAAFRLLADNSTDVVSRTDADGVCLYVSPSAATVLGYAPDEMIGSKPGELLAPEDPVPFEEARDVVRAGGDSFTITRRVRRRDGHEIWLESTSRILRDSATGELLEVQSSARDVSDRIRTEERFEALVGHSWDIITVLDGNGRWRYSSPAGTRLLGYEEGFDTPDGIVSLVHPDDVGTAVNALAEVIDGTRGPDAPVVFRVRHKDGEYRFFETIGQNLSDDPSVAGVVLNSRDVTERLEADAALRRREREVEQLASLQEREHLELELERARRFESLGRLAGGIAHDVNTLVGIILIYLNSLTPELDANSALRADAEHIRVAITRTGRLTRQLLEYGRRSDAPAEVFDPDTSISEVFKLVQTMGGDGIELIHRPAAHPVEIQIPRVHFEQMLMNVLANACDAMPDGGTLTVTTDSVTRHDDVTSQLASGDYARLQIADTGSGMTLDVAATAFEPFVTTRAGEQGTGLGLAIVERVVRDAGGAVFLDSEPGRGTVVTLLIPAAGRAAGVSEGPSRC